MAIYDDGIQIQEPCPNCGSRETYKDDEGFGFWKCERCSTVWGNDEDDPDYDEPLLCADCNGLGRLDGFGECPNCNGSGLIED